MIIGCTILALLLVTAVVPVSAAHQKATPIGISKHTLQGPPITKQRHKRHSADLTRFTNFTRLIDSLLDSENYDRRLRPGFGGKPTKVVVDINIRSMGPISEIDSMFMMDCYFRQSWVDERLRYESSNIKEMMLSTHVLNKMWTPDTFIMNGKKSYLHVITVPNMYIRISKDGSINFSQRLTIQSICPMELRRYPLDYQTCAVRIGSFSYQMEDVIYRWKYNSSKSVAKADGISMSQFNLLSVSVGDMNFSRSNQSSDVGSILETTFHLKRATGYYLLNIYIPCGMLVSISWVTFWLNREAAAGRVSLGMLTVLTTVTISMSGRSDLPQLDYLTALDLYLLMSLFFVLAAFVEYGGVNYFTKITKPDDCKPVYAFTAEELKPDPPPPEERMKNHNLFKKFLFCLAGNMKYRALLKQNRHEMNSVSVIDDISRYLFPVTFIILNFLYWFAYKDDPSDKIA